jgi:hypothetical protein
MWGSQAFVEDCLLRLLVAFVKGSATAAVYAARQTLSIKKAALEDFLCCLLKICRVIAATDFVQSQLKLVIVPSPHQGNSHLG